MANYSLNTRNAFVKNLDDPRHGTNAGYHIGGCTCPKCKEYRDEYNRKYRERRAKAKAEKAAEKARKAEPKVRVNPLDICTIDECFKPMMGKPSVHAPYCVVCGSTENLEQHHPVKRSEGKWVRDGREVRKPTLTLCRKCHSKVHSHGGYLWFRWKDAKVGDWVSGSSSITGAGWFEYLELSFPQANEWMERHPLPNGKLPSKIGYMNALDMKGWRRIK